MSILHGIKALDYKTHLVVAFAVRLAFIAYGSYHDKNSSVPYTDVDYKVFTDAARHVVSAKSPYDRHTYRYSPLLAILLVPNILLHECFGKLLFSLVDLLVGCLIRLIVKDTCKIYERHASELGIRTESALECNPVVEKRKSKQQGRPRRKNKSSSVRNKDKRAKSNADAIGDVSMCVWLYNPLSVAIATRGNSDSLAGFLVLAVLYFLQVEKRYFVAGLIHGVAVHLRLYPIVYSLSLFMYLSEFSFYETENRKGVCKNATDQKQIKNSAGGNKTNGAIVQQSQKRERKTVFKKEYLLYLVPNLDQLKLISGCLSSLTLLTSAFYLLYGYRFLYESYVYHVVRQDARHNFSLYFYLQYLTAGVRNIGIWQKVLITLPKVVLLLVLSVRYGLNKYSLNFSILAQTLVIVIYNTVLTSQYFVWILSVLPLCIWQVKINFRKTASLFTLWFAAQVAWLLPAYFLEFQGQNTFFLIWLQSISLFCAHIAILGRLIRYFVPLSSHED